MQEGAMEMARRSSGTPRLGKSAAKESERFCAGAVMMEKSQKKLQILH